MDADRFDALARSLTAAGSRRRALAATLGMALSALNLTGPDSSAAGNSGKCQRQPNECETCAKGKCRRKNGKKICKAGKIQPKAEGMACSGGSCQNGQCISPTGVVVTVPPPSGGCPSGTAACPGGCVDTGTDPRNCGNCGTRCQINASCEAGTCTCVRGVCSTVGSSCCGATTADNAICACSQNQGQFLNPETCLLTPAANCPVEQQCVGSATGCRVCCPFGSTCDPDLGTCLQ
jgi:hypothetical protein